MFVILLASMCIQRKKLRTILQSENIMVTFIRNITNLSIVILFTKYNVVTLHIVSSPSSTTYSFTMEELIFFQVCLIYLKKDKNIWGIYIQKCWYSITIRPSTLQRMLPKGRCTIADPCARTPPPCQSCSGRLIPLRLPSPPGQQF